MQLSTNESARNCWPALDEYLTSVEYFLEIARKINP